jgi:O-antigen biosynthesis protein
MPLNRESAGEPNWELAKSAIERGATQKITEFARLLSFLSARSLHTVVEIGTQRGGSFYAWCQIAAPDAVLVSIDLPGGPFGGGYSEEDELRFRTFGQPRQELHFLRMDSHAPETRRALEDALAGRPIDLLFIDGDHTYYGARKDFELYAPLVSFEGAIVFHDILPHPDLRECKVDLLWREIKDRDRFQSAEFVDPADDHGWGKWGGIGVLTPDSSADYRVRTTDGDPLVVDEVIQALAQEVSDSRALATSLQVAVQELSIERGDALDRLSPLQEKLAELTDELDTERRRAEAAQQEFVDLQELTARVEADADRYRADAEFFRRVLQTRGWKVLFAYWEARARVLGLVNRAGGWAKRGSRAAADTSTPLLLQAQRSGDPGRHQDKPRFLEVEDPVVSIVIPAFENADLTHDCLRALAGNTPLELIEVIVVDDASADSTPQMLRGIPGLVARRNAENMGFLRSCNMGASLARGDYVLFLNNDTQVTPGWLEALVDAAQSAPDIGAVGSKLVYPDGRLQEAGAIVWSDASAHNFGRGQDPDAPEFNYRREVDYCSGASLLVRRDLFEELGGFDLRFQPIYYEETDLCFLLASRGFRVLYEPRSVVRHFEGATEGTDEGSGVGGRRGKEHQYRNRHVFAQKWATRLARQLPPGTANGYLGGRVDQGPRVLVADMWLPAHDRDSGSLRMTWIVRLLTELGCQVTLFPANRERREPYASEFQRRGIEVHYGSTTFSEFAAQRAGFYDLVLLSRPDVAVAYLDDVRRYFPHSVVVYDMMDFHFVRESRRREALGLGESSEVETTRRRELSCIRRSDIVAAVTDVEEDLVQHLVPGVSTVVLPNVHPVDTGPLVPFSERTDLLFIGGFAHQPNVDAITWFANEVLPLVNEQIRTKIWVLGSDPSEEVRALQSPDIVVTGYIPEVDEYFRKARVFISPLRYGAGMKGKNGQAMSFGLPVVTTSIGAEGMGLVDGVHALIRDDAASLAKAVVDLYTDSERWELLATSGMDRVRECWSPDLMRIRLERLLSNAGLRRFRLGDRDDAPVLAASAEAVSDPDE